MSEFRSEYIARVVLDDKEASLLRDTRVTLLTVAKREPVRADLIEAYCSLIEATKSCIHTNDA